MMRRNGKQILTMLVLVCGLLMLFAPSPQAASRLSTTIVTNPLTGVAIDGWDPVSYFTEPEPRLGLPDFEYEWGGVIWYFSNAANREVFARSPDIYAPMFGGHGAMSLARGFMSDGNPRIYEIAGGRLFFFHSVANREAFRLAPATAVEGALAHWADLTRSETAAR